MQNNSLSNKKDKIKFRLALPKDISRVSQIYEDIHTAEETGSLRTCWIRGIYPTEDTALKALERGDLFVGEDNGEIFGAAIINKQQVDIYEKGKWQYTATDDKVMVLHTLVISPKIKKNGYGTAFVNFYENYAKENYCPFLRIDTNEKNKVARSLYHKLGYSEIDILQCVFNGIEGVNIVLLEKKL